MRHTFDSLGFGNGQIAQRLLKALLHLRSLINQLKLKVNVVAGIGDFEAFSIKTMKYLFLILVGSLFFSSTFAEMGKDLYLSRCAMCHGKDAKASGYLAEKSFPPTPDLTTCRFRKKLAAFPVAIISPVILQPNGKLIHETLMKNHVHLPEHVWTDEELRALNQYMLMLITKASCNPKAQK